MGLLMDFYFQNAYLILTNAHTIFYQILEKLKEQW